MGNAVVLVPQQWYVYHAFSRGTSFATSRDIATDVVVAMFVVIVVHAAIAFDIFV